MKLKTVTRTQGNNLALKQGQVRVPGIEFEFEEVPVLIDGFRRMVRGLEFDVCEMALTTYVCARAQNVRFTALPIPLVRAFHHGALVVDTDRIKTPKDLEGQRVGVNRGYTVTTGLWARHVLQHEYGVDLSKITWVLSGDEHVADWKAPPNVVPIEAGKDIAELVAEGELAGAIGIKSGRPTIAPLVSDPAEAGYAALRRTGHYPINHVVVVRDSLLAEQPELGPLIFRAFAESKHRYVEQLRAGTLPLPGAVDEVHRRVMQITGNDPLPYGLEPNRQMLQAAVDSALEQGIIGKAPSLESLFPANTQALAA